MNEDIPQKDIDGLIKSFNLVMTLPYVRAVVAFRATNDFLLLFELFPAQLEQLITATEQDKEKVLRLPSPEAVKNITNVLATLYTVRDLRSIIIKTLASYGMNVTKEFPESGL